MQFLVHIKPNLPQQYSPLDTSQYIVDLMPNCLRSEGRRIVDDMKERGTFLDHLAVLRRCRSIVYDEQKPAALKQPAFVTISPDALGGHDIAAMSLATGIDLRFPDSFTPALVSSGDTQKWCPQCPHKGECYCSPGYKGPAPVCSSREKLLQ